MKYFAAALICVALCALGLYKAAELKKRTGCLVAIRILFEKCAELIERTDCDAFGLLQELAVCPALSGFTFLSEACTQMLSGLSFADAFFTSSDVTGELDILNEEQKQLLSDYILGFSSCSRERLLQKTGEYAIIFGKRAEEARDYSCKNGRLYAAAGFLCGALVLIII